MRLAELRQIGLTEGEIKVYQALLDLGECTKTALAKKSGVAPSNIYDIVNRLAEKGLVSKVEKDGVTHFSPANPRHIIDFLDQKHREIDKERKVAEALLPQLLTKYTQAAEKVNVEVFQGWKGLRTIFKDLIAECKRGDYNYVFGASAGAEPGRTDRFFVKYSRLRAKKGIVTNIIFNEELKRRKDRTEFFLKSNKYRVKFLPQTTPAEIMIYKNKVCIIMLVGSPLTIRVTSKEAADSFKHYFDVMWKLAKR